MTTDQAAIVQAYASVAGVVLTSLGLVAIWAQIRGASRASTTQNSSLFMLGDHRRVLIDDANAALDGVFEFMGNYQMSPETAAHIFSRPDLKVKFSRVLNHYEDIASGIKCGALDEKLFRVASSRSFRLLVWQTIHYIRLVRKESRNDNIFAELEALAERWDRWTNASPHFFSRGEVIVGVEFSELKVPTTEDRVFPRHLRPM